MKTVWLPMMALAALIAADADKSVFFGLDFTHQPIPRYGYGRLVAFLGDHQTVMATRRDGSIAYSKPIHLPEGSISNVHDVAIHDSGRVAVVASLKGRVGLYPSAIVWLDVNGNVERAVRTAPFVPRKLHYAKDGKVWAIGDVLDVKERAQEANAMRIFDGSGQEVRSFYPLTGKTGLSWMLATEKGVAVTIPQLKRYVEFAENGEVLRTIAYPDRRGFRVFGSAHTVKGEPILHAAWYAEDAGDTTALGTLVYDSEKKLWADSKLQSSIGKKRLLGNEGKEELAVYDHAKRSLLFVPMD